MIKTTRFLKVIFVLFVVLGCERYDDTVLVVKVVSENVPVEGITVSVEKRKPALIYGTKTVNTYSAQTDADGECHLVIEDYNNDKYDYSVDVNQYTGNPVDFGGFTYSVWGTVLEYNELNEVLEVRLSKIPFPDITGRN